ncbi:ShlB/FhaC/HecB family hemolysin secretion/activation protein [Litoribrevibacter euphylliae]|uniref:ShlB/FhaC/HecB family hemolysin secretion/activation protein n=1 Tax=Litoribrevibacter euphylliae TaxID=1834034 RepID=A0ABV7HHN1_9GAMM
MQFVKSNLLPLAVGTFISAVSFIPVSSVAADLPNALPQSIDPGARDRELQRREERLEQKQRQDNSPVIDDGSESSEEASSDTAETTFKLNSIRFTKSELLTRDELTAIVKPWLGKDVSLSDLNKIVDQVNKLYRAKSIFTATALLPKQEIKDGVVIIRIVEGKLGKVGVEGNGYLSEDYVQSWLEDQKNNTNIDIKFLEKDIQRFNRVNDQRLVAELRAGETFGLTDIVVNVQEPERNTFQLFADNYGYESSGENEVGFYYQRQKLWLDGDRSLFYTTRTKGASSYSVSYNAPVKNTGLRLGMSGSYSDTEVVEGDFADVEVKGDSQALNFDASWLAFSSSNFWLNLVATAGHTWSETEVEEVDLSKYKLVQTQGGVQLTWFGPSWQVSARQTIGFSENQDQLLDKSRQFMLLKGNLTAISRPLPINVYGLFQSDWQFVDEEGLPGSVSYSLGGPASVRAYDPGFVSGDEGYYIESELHYDGFTLAQGTFDTYLFYDWGQVKSLNPTETLAALGAGVAWQSQGWAFDFTVARAMKEVVPGQDDWASFGRVSVSF